MRLSFTILTLALLAIFATDTPAAQIVLRSTAQVTGPIVQLGDVADIVSTDAKEKYRLESVELFPVPSNGKKRYLRQREIQDLLTLSGVSLARHRFSGSSRVAVYGEPQKTTKKKLAPISTTAGRRAKEKAEKAIFGYIEEMAAPKKPNPWSIDAQLDEQKIRTILKPGTRVFVAKADEIQVGNCRFIFDVRSLKGESNQLEVDAQLSLPNAVVATVRRLPRGVVIQAADVEMVYDTPTSQQVQGFYSMSEVVGKELIQSIGAGKVIPTDQLRSPVVVRKGEVVTVVSRAAGISVSTNGRAKEDGGMGELVPVESLENREIYFAKVTGLRELEVLAGTVTVQPTPNEPVRPYVKNKVFTRRQASPRASNSTAFQRR